MKIRLFILAMLTLTVMGCERNIEITDTDSNEGKIVTISASISPETRVTYNDADLSLAWENNDKILLVGFAGATYIGSELFTYTGNGNKFTGKEVVGATTYKAYYPGEGAYIDEESGEVYDFDIDYEPTQNGNNSSSHLNNCIALADAVAKPLNQNFTLSSIISIVKFEITNVPKEVGTLTKLVWTAYNIWEGEVSEQDWFLNVTGVTFSDETNSFTAFLPFIPEWTCVPQNKSVTLGLIGDESVFWVSEPLATAKNYEPGKRYTATINVNWIKRFSFQRSNAGEVYQIRQKLTDGGDPTSPYSPAKMIINWGDNSESTIINKNDPLSEIIAEHDYPDLPENTSRGYRISIYYDELNDNVKQLPQIIFREDNSLSEIWDPLPNMGTEDFSYYFHNCIYLMRVEKGLFDRNKEATNFNNCFSGCSRLSLKSDIFPNAEAFKDKNMDFTECFKNASVYPRISEYGYSTAPELWNFTKGTGAWTTTDCFTGAKLTNYSSVPADWGVAVAF